MHTDDFRIDYCKPVPHNRLAVNAWESLFRAQHEVYNDIKADFEDDSPLTQSEYDVLLTVTRAPEMTARLRDVTDKMLVSQPSVSRLVERMVARGLVTKAPDPEDGRGALVTATEYGAEQFTMIARRHAAHIARRMRVLDEAQLNSLLEITRTLRKAPTTQQN